MKNSNKHKKVVKNSVGRVLFVGTAVILQIFWLVFVISRTGDYFPYITVGTQIAAIGAVVAIYSQRKSSGSKMLWIAMTLAFPVFGLVLFTLIGQPWSSRIVRKRIKSPEFERTSDGKEPFDGHCAIPECDRGIQAQLRYLSEWCRFPIFKDNEIRYHGDTKEAYDDLLNALKTARDFIFMEYHAVEDARSFAPIKAILAEKAAAGVDVRLLYDDVGSAVFVHKDFCREMNALGIKCRIFNPLVPFVLAFMNNRDHRKITVIDGKIGFTGGYNLTDEYFNLVSPYGYWKDTGIMIKGSAVVSLTRIFMELWNSEIGPAPIPARYLVTPEASESPAGGYVVPYCDSPLDDERVGENVYLNAIKNARRRVWFTTPYLILDDEMISELTLAAKRGLDVRVVTPGIPDKKIIYQLTRANYNQLIPAGIRIYEYTPGFIHAKQLLVDDDVAVVGTINLDYRSLYLHFENAVLMIGCECIKDIDAALIDTFNQSREITRADIDSRPLRVRIMQNALRMFGPLV